MLTSLYLVVSAWAGDAEVERAAVIVNKVALDLSAPALQVAEVLRASGLTCTEGREKGGAIVGYVCVIPSPDGDYASEVAIHLSVESGVLRDIRMESMSTTNFEAARSAVTNGLGTPRSKRLEKDGVATEYGVGGITVTMYTFPCDESCTLVLRPSVSPADEQAAAALLASARNAAAAGEVTSARQLLSDLGSRYPSTTANKRASRLSTELSFIGGPAPDLDVERWYSADPGSYASRPYTLLVFFETWDPHSGEAAPELARLANAHSELGLIGLTRRNKSATDESVASFITTHGWTFPVGKERDGSVSQAFAVIAVPSAALVHDGKVVWRGHPKSLDGAAMERLLGGQSPAAPSTLKARADEGAGALSCSKCVAVVGAGVRASSELSDGKRSYPASQALDRVASTAWCEGVKGNGIGETLTVDLGATREVGGFWITPGYAASERTLFDNGRVRTLTVRADGGRIFELTLPDQSRGVWGQAQLDYASFYVDFLSDPAMRSLLSARTLEFGIGEVHAGDKFEDTCVSELQIWSVP